MTTESTTYTAGTVVTSDWLNAVDASIFDDIANVKRHGATGDGVTDDTAALQAAIDAAPEGSLVFIPAGTYLTSSSLTVTKSITICGSGYGSVVKSSTGGTHIIILIQSATFAAINGVRLENFRIDGNSCGQLDAGLIVINNAVGFIAQKLWIENGTRVSGSSGVNGITCSAGTPGGVGSSGVIRDCYFENLTKAAINWTSESTSALIEGNTITGLGGNGTCPGIQINGGFNGKIIGNHITDTEGPGIYAATDSLGNVSRNLVILGNTVEACGASSTTQGDGILLAATASTGRVIIANNILVDNGTNTNGGSGISVSGHSNLLISNNLCRNNRFDGIRIQNSNHVSITGNRCTGNNLAAVSYAGGIQVLGTSSHISIVGNHCSDDKGTATQSYGIILTSGAVLSYLTIEANHLEGNVAGPLLADAGAKPMRISMVVTKQSTDGSAETAQYISLPDDVALLVHAKSIGKKTDGSDRAIYSREALFYLDGGALTQQGSTTTIGTDIESNAAWGGLELTAAGGLALVKVTGVAATTIDWRVTLEVQSI